MRQLGAAKDLERDARDAGFFVVRVMEVDASGFDVRARAPRFALGERSGAEHDLRRRDDQRRLAHR